MEKFHKLMCIKGLIFSLEDQICRYHQNKELTKEIENKIITQYWDAIKEQLGEKNIFDKKVKLIKSLHKRGIISDNTLNELLNDEVPDDIKIAEKIVAFNIKINDVYISWQKEWITAKELIRLSQDVINPNDDWDITYVGHTYNGSLEKDIDSVKVEENMLFTVLKMIKE